MSSTEALCPVEAVDQLARSPRGRKALRAIHEFMSDIGSGLDSGNRLAVEEVLRTYWTAPATMSACITVKLSKTNEVHTI